MCRDETNQMPLQRSWSICTADVWNGFFVCPVPAVCNQNLKRSSIVRKPWWLTVYSAANTAPKAKPFRLWAS